jgi:PAS domain S-box-containing protein
MPPNLPRPGLIRRIFGARRSSAAERRLAAFFTAAPAGLAILDRELRYVQLNETLAAMNGLSVADHLGRRMRDVVPALAPVVEPVLQRILATGEPALNIEVSGETPARPGAVRHWVASYFPLPGPADEPDGIGAIVVEDTARRRAEQARRRSGAEFRAIVEQASYGVYRSTLDGRFVRVNPALVRMLGYESEAAVLALDLARDVYVDPSERDRLIALHRAARRIQGVEVQWKRKDGRPILVRLSGQPLRDDSGAVTGFAMVAEDVTEQRTLERALQQAQKMEAVGQLTSGIAHDFNNVLTVILTHARLLGHQLPPDRADLRKDLDDLHSAAEHGAQLVQKLLGFSRSRRLELQPLDFSRRVREIVELLRRVLPASIEVRCDAEDDTGIVEADPAALEQILLNLATNARDAMPQGGTLHVDVRAADLAEEDRPLHAWVRPGRYVCVAVSDTGVGMDAATLARVFEPFFTTKPAGVGTGLGMAMVYGLVKQHRGFVHLYSEVGQGTTVKVYLPRAAGAATDDGVRRGDAPLQGGTERILVIEDDPALRAAAARLLTKVGYRVLTAADGVEGLSLFRSRASEVDLVLTDVVMPRLGGLELYQALRRERPDIRVLFTSGYPPQQFRDRLGRGAAVGFVTKPWTAGELLRQLRALLDEAGGDRAGTPPTTVSPARGRG